jgi:hypothetical protein
MSEDRKYFEVVVQGQYHALNDVSGTPTLKNYKETFILPSQESALSAICKHLLSPRLKKTHADFIRFRTHELVSITLKGYKPNAEVLQLDIDEMSLLELSDFCILRQLMIDPYKHSAKDIFAIREMVKKAYLTKRQAAKDNRESKASVENTEAETLRKANGLESQSKDIQINENEHKATQAMRAKEKTHDPEGPAPTIGPVEPADEPLPPVEQDDPNAEPSIE